MTDIIPTVVSNLTTDTGLPVLYELFLDSTDPIPCISYQIYNSYDESVGDTLSYSILQLMVKLWVDITDDDLDDYKLLIDKSMKEMKFRLVSYGELGIDNELCIMMVYEGLVKEIGE